MMNGSCTGYVCVYSVYNRDGYLFLPFFFLRTWGNIRLPVFPSFPKISSYSGQMIGISKRPFAMCNVHLVQSARCGSIYTYDAWACECLWHFHTEVQHVTRA